MNGLASASDQWIWSIRRELMDSIFYWCHRQIVGRNIGTFKHYQLKKRCLYLKLITLLGADVFPFSNVFSIFSYKFHSTLLAATGFHLFHLKLRFKIAIDNRYIGQGDEHFGSRYCLNKLKTSKEFRLSFNLEWNLWNNHHGPEM